MFKPASKQAGAYSAREYFVRALSFLSPCAPFINIGFGVFAVAFADAFAIVASLKYGRSDAEPNTATVCTV